MKKNLSGILLVAEIVVVILFHTFKIRQPKKIVLKTILSGTAKASKTFLVSNPCSKAKPEYFFLNMLK